MSQLTQEYEALTKIASRDLKSTKVTDSLTKLILTGLDHLETQATISQANSEVPGKNYFNFVSRDAKKQSRPVNAGLFEAQITKKHVSDLFNAKAQSLSTTEISRVLYTSAMAYCCATDLTKSQDRKTPGTFFEIMVGHIFAKTYGVNPDRRIQVLNLDMETSLPTDFVFDFGPEKSRLHLPVKTSTRERVIQVWAHQRVLDGVYGTNRFRGILVCINETNMKTKSNSVVEVCLPGQWMLYQMFISQLHRVYYLDVPEKYASLADVYPFIQVKSFAEFFNETDKLIGAPSL